MQSLRQTQIIPSGCQGWHSRVLASSDEKFAFASTLALYVYSLEDFTLNHLIAAHEKTITGVVWSPHDKNLLVSWHVVCSLNHPQFISKHLMSFYFVFSFVSLI